ncbi:MAG: carboxylate-amine ligase [Robiginitomaculum sp.]|nr:carboxylate-amine ligase [Robiginitomaculum sp.]MDQ7076872.1 carboxylate-amine ligase [Robiginitomaculum sp.]
MIPILTLGIEEEYLIVDPASGNLATEPPAGLMEDCKAELGDSVTPEFLKCQIEIATPVCETIGEARRHLVAMRSCIKRVARQYGYELMAASTHPFAKWHGQRHTEAPRYEKLDADMQGAIRRMLICGMHVHAGIEDPDMRIGLMNQMRYFLPHLLALSTSSPFWGGHKMGMMSYRTTVWDGMPRNGIPDRFESWGEYERLCKRLIMAGVIEDSSKIWWDLRPSARFPTLEMRITDVCPRMEDALCIAAIYICLLRMLARLRRANMKWRVYPRLLVQENRWLASRFGVNGRLVDLGKGAQTPFATLLEEILEIIEEDAVALECLEEVHHARKIVERGSSASQQLAVYEQAMAQGASKPEALKAVVDHLIKETAADLPDAGHSD